MIVFIEKLIENKERFKTFFSKNFHERKVKLTYKKLFEIIMNENF